MWIDDEISDDEAYMQLALSNAQSEMDGIERAIHVYRWCVPGKGGRGQSGERDITPYAKRLGVTQSGASKMRDAGEFEAATKPMNQFMGFNPQWTLWYELSKAPQACWNALRSAVEKDLVKEKVGEYKEEYVNKKWTVAYAKKVVKAINDTLAMIPDWWIYSKPEAVQMAVSDEGRMKRFQSIIPLPFPRQSQRSNP